jgi:hypothetical protein
VTTTSARPSPEAPQLDPAAEQAFLADLTTGGLLLGDYRESELAQLGAGFCENRREGLDPFADGQPGDDGTYEFDGVGVPVWAMDAIAIDLAARKHVCRDVA